MVKAHIILYNATIMDKTHTLRIDAIIDYWFDAIDDDISTLDERNALWWQKRPETDRFIEKMFHSDMRKAQTQALEQWLTEPRGRLALIILLDQFSRNVYRDQAKAYEFDAVALTIAKEGITLGHDQQVSYFQRTFFYLPFEHSEAAEDQITSIALYDTLRQSVPASMKRIFEGFYDYALQHKAVIDRFGRFPHRNPILNRTSTAEEKQYLSQPGAGF